MRDAPTYYYPTATGGPSTCACAWQRRRADDPGLLAHESGDAELPHTDACARECLRAEVVAGASAGDMAAQDYSTPKSMPPAEALRRAAVLENKRVQSS